MSTATTLKYLPDKSETNRPLFFPLDNKNNHINEVGKKCEQVRFLLSESHIVRYPPRLKYARSQL